MGGGSGMAHWFEELQVWPLGQLLQVNVLPHPSARVPQLCPWDAHVLHTTHLLETQLLPDAHAPPQFKVPPHPSGTDPQFSPWDAQVIG
jgi:hypothetical protein